MLIPDHETAVDFLNYEAVSKTVVALLKANRNRALTIGIHGDWGAGKSSVLTMVQAAAAQDKSVACLWFNGWTFQGFDDAKTVLIEVIVAELVRQRGTIGKVKKIGGQLLRRVDVMKIARRGAGVAFNIATGMPSVDQIDTAAEILQAVGESVKTMSPEVIKDKLAEAATFLKPAEERSLPDQIHHFREEFAELLAEAKIDQLVVLIDDLDRCLPATAIDTLEAIRLFLFVPKTAFIIGADEGMIEYAVRQHFPNLNLASGGVPYTRNYLEKLIQVPFRIPALGIQESRAYVTLLLVQGLVGEDHAGFAKLLEKARKSLNQPWLGAGISLADVRAVNPAKKDDLGSAYVLAQQIGPILAEGIKGNPRQIKRFLNSLSIRMSIAQERGFEDGMNAAILGKLMLAERFQPDFYDYVAAKAMLSRDGKFDDLAEMEAAAQESDKPAKAAKGGKNHRGDTPGACLEGDAARWFGRDWVHRWLKIEPALGGEDLRPYVFVARDKRIIGDAAETTGLEALIEGLTSPSDIAVRSMEQQVKALLPADAAQVFATLQERVLRQGTFSAEPSGFAGLMLIAKYHPRHQTELLALLEGIDAKDLGFWIAKGWNDVITEPAAVQQLQALLSRWATQDSNPRLKTVAEQAIASTRGRTH